MTEAARRLHPLAADRGRHDLQRPACASRRQQGLREARRCRRPPGDGSMAPISRASIRSWRSRCCTTSGSTFLGTSRRAWMPRRKGRPRPLSKGFREAAERSGVAYETRTDHALDTTLASVLSMHARYADLVVLGQVDPDEPPYVGHCPPEQVVLSSGRPALIVPYRWPLDTLAERVLIAWDASREAARAVSDALPILAAGDFRARGERQPEEHAARPRRAAGRRHRLHLARHEIEVEVRSVERDPSDAVKRSCPSPPIAAAICWSWAPTRTRACASWCSAAQPGRFSRT